MPESIEVNTPVHATIEFTIEELVTDGEPLNDPEPALGCGCSGCTGDTPPPVL